MSAEVEIHRLAEAVIWQRYDATVKTDLFSTALPTVGGTYLIDPIELKPDEIESVIGGRQVAGIIITNVNHARASAFFRNRFAVPVYAQRAAHADLALTGPIQNIEDSELSELSVLSVAGAALGEIALHSTARSGTLILGDALINAGSLGFTFLPAKYCSNHKLMRKSLRRLLDYEFDRIFFAHGTPIITRARQRLAALLECEG